MKLPRYIDGRELADLLSRYGYSIIRQTGSHLRLMSDLREEVHNLTIPRSQATQDRHLECRALGRRQIPGDGQAGACRPALRAIDSSCRWGDGRAKGQCGLHAMGNPRAPWRIFLFPAMRGGAHRSPD
jgi:predicted RNA binding protein YcfA (HicA-like mRNA interferase family)